MKGFRARLKSWQWKPVDTTLKRGALVLHRSLADAERFTVSHSRTGFAVWSSQSYEHALAFLETACAWPEWEHVTELADAQFLRPRVLQLRQQVLNSVEAAA